MELAYANYTNLDAGFTRHYAPGDRLVRGHRGTIDVGTREDVMVMGERLYLRRNRDVRPDGQLCPSMSIGDVVVIGEVAVSIAGVALRLGDVGARDLITERGWSDVISQRRPAVDPAVRGIVAGSVGAADQPSPPLIGRRDRAVTGPRREVRPTPATDELGVGAYRATDAGSLPMRFAAAAPDCPEAES